MSKPTRNLSDPSKPSKLTKHAAKANPTKKIARQVDTPLLRSRYETHFVKQMNIPINGEALIMELHRGFDYDLYDRLSKESGLEKQLISKAIGIPKATLNRRAASGKFSTEESDRMFRLIRIIDAAIELFEGSRESAVDWLQRPARGLGGRTPMDMVTTSVQYEAVLNLIGRLEHGIPS